MSTDPVFSEVQKINPSAIIELFVLQLDTALHGANTIYRFHAGSNLNAKNLSNVFFLNNHCETVLKKNYKGTDFFLL